MRDEIDTARVSRGIALRHPQRRAVAPEIEPEVEWSFGGALSLIDYAATRVRAAAASGMTELTQ